MRGLILIGLTILLSSLHLLSLICLATHCKILHPYPSILLRHKSMTLCIQVTVHVAVTSSPSVIVITVVPVVCIPYEVFQ